MIDPPDRPPERRVVLYIRQHASAALVEGLCRLVGRVRRLETDGIAAVEIATWGPVTPALEAFGDTGPTTMLTAESFLAWAEREGYTLQPAFSRRDASSLVGPESSTELRVPTACLAVYVDGALTFVAPCSDGERTHSVAACLDALEAGRTDPFATLRPHEPPREDAGMVLE